MSGRESIGGISDCDIALWKHVFRGRLRGVECPKTVRSYISTDGDMQQFTAVGRRLFH